MVNLRSSVHAILIICLPWALQAQNGFEAGLRMNGLVGALGVLPLPDGGAIAYGGKELGAVAVRLSAEGDTVWMHEESIPGFMNDAVLGPDGAVYFSAGGSNGQFSPHVLMARWGIDGSIHWSRTFNYQSQSTTSVWGVAMAADSLPVWLSQVDNSSFRRAVFIKMDTLGEPVWQRSVNLPAATFHFRRIRSTADGGFVVAAHMPVLSAFVLLRVNAEIQPLWMRRFGNTLLEPHDVAVLQNGDFLVVGRLGYVVRIDPDGNVIWSNRYLVGPHSTHYVSALERPDGELVLCGHASTAAAPGPFYNAAVVVRLAPDGTVLGGSASRQRMVPSGPGYKQYNRGALAPDGGLVLAGQLSIPVSGQVFHYGMHVIKTTDDLLLGCEDEPIPTIQTLPITAPATTITGLSAGTWAVPHTALVPERVYTLAAYRYCTTTDVPEEPADAVPLRVLVGEEGLRIVASRPAQAPRRLELHDALGRLVAHGLLRAGEQEMGLPMGLAAPGVYIVGLQDAGTVRVVWE